MKEDIFKNAYFGKPYKTKDGRKAIYTIMSCNSHWLTVQDTSFTWKYNDNGQLISEIDHAMDIVSEWQEPVDEVELDKLTKKYIKNSDFNNDTEEYCRMSWIEEEAFKAGYRKAKEE